MHGLCHGRIVGSVNSRRQASTRCNGARTRSRAGCRVLCGHSLLAPALCLTPLPFSLSLSVISLPRALSETVKPHPLKPQPCPDPPHEAISTSFTERKNALSTAPLASPIPLVAGGPLAVVGKVLGVVGAAFTAVDSVAGRGVGAVGVRGDAAATAIPVAVKGGGG